MSKKYILWVLVILWMAFIFTLSGEGRDASSSRSQQATLIVQQVIEQLPAEVKQTIDKDKISEGFLRKISHVLEYFVLTCFVLFASVKSNISKKRVYYNALIIPAWFACTDELHQFFIPGRGPQVIDVFIDGIGIVLAISLFFALTIIKDFYMHYKEARM